ncbi:CPBP family intramembrane glutamic endopeptidase [Arthrobacter sp. Br18]|uniref:CPBP family intramembrane glutamic endopeptidase n=1 Tax=Arthrobacter sp. Br18 TaxID=1312954 RepID=UPI0004B4C33D|nr:CPBP family intramembrane glutamic endopeptidase [Arthrobacter sp. Br18]
MSRTAAAPSAVRHATWNVLPAGMTAASGFLLFGLGLQWQGYVLLAGALAVSAVLSRALLRDLALIALGILIMNAVPITTDISVSHMTVMGSAMAAAVGLPYLISRFVYREHAIRFPVLTGQKWSPVERWYLPAVVVIGYLLLPVYLVPTGVYENWPAADDAGSVARLFLGTNVLGIWDELFFICTVFTLLRRHILEWQANLLQAVLFTSFLWELGFHAWGPVLIYPFALVQGWIFARTKSLTYVVSVHLLFDFVLFLVLLHAHNRDLFPIFLY